LGFSSGLSPVFSSVFALTTLVNGESFVLPNPKGEAVFFCFISLLLIPGNNYFFGFSSTYSDSDFFTLLRNDMVTGAFSLCSFTFSATGNKGDLTSGSSFWPSSSSVISAFTFDF